MIRQRRSNNIGRGGARDPAANAVVVASGGCSSTPASAQQTAMPNRPSTRPGKPPQPGLAASRRSEHGHPPLKKRAGSPGAARDAGAGGWRVAVVGSHRSPATPRPPPFERRRGLSSSCLRRACSHVRSSAKTPSTSVTRQRKASTPGASSRREDRRHFWAAPPAANASSVPAMPAAPG